MAEDSTNKNVESATAGVAEIRLDGKKNEISFLIMWCAQTLHMLLIQ